MNHFSEALIYCAI